MPEEGGVFHVKHAVFFVCARRGSVAQTIETLTPADKYSGVNGLKLETVIIRAYHFF